jgi:hypothetical protein
MAVQSWTSEEGNIVLTQGSANSKDPLVLLVPTGQKSVGGWEQWPI